MCGKPTINGNPGYSWNGEAAHTYPVNAPDMVEGDQLLYDEPGRCGGLDSHSYHLRVVRRRYGGYVLLVRHGGGEESLSMGSSKMAIEALAALDSNARYWLLIQIYHCASKMCQQTLEACNHKWRQAAAEKRIKTRKRRGTNAVKVWIEAET